MRQSRLPKNWVKDSAESSDSDEALLNLDDAKKCRQPAMWTRVKNMSQIEANEVTVYDIMKDLKQDKTLREIRKHIAD